MITNNNQKKKKKIEQKKKDCWIGYSLVVAWMRILWISLNHTKRGMFCWWEEGFHGEYIVTCFFTRTVWSPLTPGVPREFGEHTLVGSGEFETRETERDFSCHCDTSGITLCRATFHAVNLDLKFFNHSIIAFNWSSFLSFWKKKIYIYISLS